MIPETVIEFASIVKTQTNLDALMLLTLADGQGTDGELVGLEGVARLAALSRDLAITCATRSAFLAQIENRARSPAECGRGTTLTRFRG